MIESEICLVNLGAGCDLLVIKPHILRLKYINILPLPIRLHATNLIRLILLIRHCRLKHCQITHSNLKYLIHMHQYLIKRWPLIRVKVHHR